MENNNPTNPTQTPPTSQPAQTPVAQTASTPPTQSMPATQPTTPAAPSAQTPQATVPVWSPAPSNTHKSRFGLLFIILFILGILFLGGTYLFVASQKKSTSAMPIVNKDAQIQTKVHQIEEQVPADDSNNSSKDFDQVDQEMKNL